MLIMSIKNNLQYLSMGPGGVCNPLFYMHLNDVKRDVNFYCGRSF